MYMDAPVPGLEKYLSKRFMLKYCFNLTEEDLNEYERLMNIEYNYARYNQAMKVVKEK